MKEYGETAALNVDEAPLRSVLESTENSLEAAHSLIDELEGRIFGPRPMAVGIGQQNAANTPVPYSGLRAGVNAVAREAGRLNARLRELLSAL